MTWRRFKNARAGRLLAGVFLVTSLLLLVPAPAAAQAAAGSGEFYLQVSPSPLVATLKPGVPTELELKIRNAGSSTEDLKIEPRSFKLDDTSGEVALDDTTPPDIARWVSFGTTNFTIRPGEWYTQKVRIALPKEAGFSYSFALLVSRRDAPKPIEGGRLIKGSVAVFTLVNVDRPGSTRKLDIVGFESVQGVYEYLPADLKVRLHNTGNSIVQPYGNVYIQRGSKDTEPIGTLPLNDKRSYILPGSTRTLDVAWQDGFPAYRTTSTSGGGQKTALEWNWNKVGTFRIGKYTAKLVAVYSDGTRDVPLERTVTFWVIPWKILLGAAVVAGLILFALISILLKITRAVRRRKARKTVSLPPTEE